MSEPIYFEGPDDAPSHPCPHCECRVRDDDPVDFGGCCSEICRLVIEEGMWPSPVGPASHDEMVGWIEQLGPPPAPEAA